jgi:hypothetical protein
MVAQIAVMLALAVVPAVGVSAAPANAAAPAYAAPDRPGPSPVVPRSLDQNAGEREADATAATCPTGGQRVKTSSSADVYLVGPALRLYWIPDPTVYFSLWDSWNGVVTNDSLWNCYSSAAILYGAALVKLSSSAAIYIYDDFYGGDRWIPNVATFNKYAFSWAKVTTVPFLFREPPPPDWT